MIVGVKVKVFVGIIVNVGGTFVGVRVAAGKSLVDISVAVGVGVISELFPAAFLSKTKPKQ